MRDFPFREGQGKILTVICTWSQLGLANLTQIQQPFYNIHGLFLMI